MSGHEKISAVVCMLSVCVINREKCTESADTDVKEENNRMFRLTELWVLSITHNHILSIAKSFPEHI